MSGTATPAAQKSATRIQTLRETFLGNIMIKDASEGMAGKSSGATFADEGIYLPAKTTKHFRNMFEHDFIYERFVLCCQCKR